MHPRASGDAAYHGKALLVERTTFTTRLPANAALYAPAPPRTGKRGRPRLKGHRLGHPRRTGRHRRLAPGHGVALRPPRYRRDRRDPPPSGTARSATPPGRTVLVRDPGSDKVLAIFTTDTAAAPNASWPATRTAGRSRPPSPPANNCSASARPATACGARWNAPCRSSFCVYSLVIVWYTLHGYHPDDLAAPPPDQPWYPHKDDIAFEDMLAKLRRTLVAARITGVAAAQPDPRKYRDYGRNAEIGITAIIPRFGLCRVGGGMHCAGGGSVLRARHNYRASGMRAGRRGACSGRWLCRGARCGRVLVP